MNKQAEKNTASIDALKAAIAACAADSLAARTDKEFRCRDFVARLAGKLDAMNEGELADQVGAVAGSAPRHSTGEPDEGLSSSREHRWFY